MAYTYNDGGRAEAGFKGVMDCGVRAYAVALQVPYKEARRILKKHTKAGMAGDGALSKGIFKKDYDSALKAAGWEWHKAPTFPGRKARHYDMPKGRVIVKMAKHFAAVVDGELQDVFDSSDKMVYGYWRKL